MIWNVLLFDFQNIILGTLWCQMRNTMIISQNGLRYFLTVGCNGMMVPGASWSESPSSSGSVVLSKHTWSASTLRFFSLMFMIKRPCVFGEIWARPSLCSLQHQTVCSASATRPDNLIKVTFAEEKQRTQIICTGCSHLSRRDDWRHQSYGRWSWSCFAGGLWQTDRAQEVHVIDRKQVDTLGEKCHVKNMCKSHFMPF